MLNGPDICVLNRLAVANSQRNQKWGSDAGYLAASATMLQGLLPYTFFRISNSGFLRGN